MKRFVLSLFILLGIYQVSKAQTNPKQTSPLSKAEQEVIDLSKTKWLWMADKNVDSLNKLFDEKSVFVHMGGSWGKEREINVIKSGGIWYKKADVHEASINIIENTAVVLNRITLLAIVGGNEVTNPFIVTEVYTKKTNGWKMAALSFTKINVPVQ